MENNNECRLYELASILSPSIYETVFHNQYKSRLDKEAFILDNDTFDKCYISRNGYRTFIQSNMDRIGKALDYIGFHQMHGAKIVSIDKDKNDYVLTLEDKSLEYLAETLIKMKSLDVSPCVYNIKIIFKNTGYYSHNILGKCEKLVRVEEELKDVLYMQDQITYIDDEKIGFVIAAKNIEETNDLYADMKYVVLECKCIEIIEDAKEIWKEHFKDDFSMLYEYFINTRKSSNVYIEQALCQNIIRDYEEFVQGFLL